MSSDFMLDIISDIAEDQADAVSGQGSTSRELEAATRRLAGGWSRAFGELTGIQAAKDYASDQERIARIRTSRSKYTQSIDEVDGVGSLGSYTAKLLLSSAPEMASIIIPGGIAAKVGSKLAAGGVAVAAGAPPAVGRSFDAQLEQSGTTDAPSAVASGVAQSALNLAGFEGLALRGGLRVGTAATRLGRASQIGSAAALREGVTEGAQQLLEEGARVGVDENYDVLNPQARKRVSESIIGGVLAGGTLGTAAGVVSKRVSDQEVPPDGEPTDITRNDENAPKTEQLLLPPPAIRGDSTGRLYLPGGPTSEEVARASGIPQERIDAGLRGNPAADIVSDTPATDTPSFVSNGEFTDFVGADKLLETLRFTSKGYDAKYVKKFYDQVVPLLRQGDAVGAAQKLDEANSALETAKISEDTILRRMALHDAVLPFVRELSTLKDKVAAEKQGFISQQIQDDIEVAQQIAAPPAQVTLPPVDNEQSVQQVREQNDLMAQREQAELQNQRLASTALEVEGRRVDGVRRARAALLQDIIDDPNTKNPNKRFLSALRSTFGKEALPTEEEYNTLARFNDVRKALEKDPTLIEGPPANTQDTTLGVPERAAPPAKVAPKPVKASKAPSEPVQTELFRPNQMTAQGRTKAQRLNTELATRAETFPQGEPPPAQPSKAQGELFTPTGRPTKAALGESAASQEVRVQEAIARAPGKKAQGIVQRAAEATEGQRGRAAFVAEVSNLVQKRKLPQAEAMVRDVETRNRLEITGQQLEPTPPPANPAPAPAAKPAPKTLSPDTMRDLISRGMDSGAFDMEDAMRLYKRLDEGTPESLQAVEQELAATARARRSESKPPRTRQTPDDAAESRGTGDPYARYDDNASFVKERLAALTGKWTNPPEFVLVGKDFQPTTDAEALMKRDWARSRVPGNDVTFGQYVYGSGKVYIDQDSFTSPENLEATIFHESLGHYGLEGAYGAQLQNRMVDIYNTTPEVRELVDERMKGRANNVRNRSARSQVAYHTEEILSEAAQLNPDTTRSLMGRVADLITSFARRMGLKRGAYSDAELKAMLRYAQEYVTKGTKKPFRHQGAADFRKAAQEMERPVSVAALRDVARSEGRTPSPLAERVARPRDADARLVETVAKLTSNGELQRVMLRYGRNVRDAGQKFVYGMSFGRDLVNQLEPMMPSVRKYFDYMQARVAEATQRQQALDRIMLNAYTSLTSEERTKTSAFVKQSTLSGKWGFKPDWLPKAQVDARTAAKFNELTPQAQQVVRDMFEYGHNSRQELREAVKQMIEEEGGDRSVVERRLKMIDTKIPVLDGPYAPLMRFGNFVMVMKSKRFQKVEQRLELEPTQQNRDALNELRANADDYRVVFHETIGKAQEMADGLRKQFPNFDFDVKEREFMNRELQGAPWEGLLRLKNIVEDELPDNLAADQRRKINEMLTDLYLSSLADNSVRRQDMRREGIEGADDNMFRAFITKGRGDSHFIAAIKNNAKMTEALSEMRDQAKAKGGDFSTEDKMRGFNEVLRRHVDGMANNHTPWQDFLARMTSFWTLLTLPRYYLQNATQTYLVTAPVLSAEHGASGATSAINAAYGDLIRGFGKSWSNFFKGDLDLSKMRKEDGTPFDPTELKALEAFRDSGLLDIGLSYDLGYWENFKESGPMRLMQNTLHRMTATVRSVEMANRVSSGLAAYRLIKKRRPGISEEAAIRYASDIISQTQGDYTRENAPRYFNVPGGKLLFQFRKYQLLQASLLVRNMHNALQGASPEERALARATLRNVLATTAVFTGALGLPAVQGTAYIMSALFGDDEEPADGDKFLRGLIGNEELANILLTGVPAAAGLDVSANLGMSTAFSIAPYSDLTPTNREELGKTLIGLGGPFMGVAANMVDGMGMMAQGDYWRGTEQMLPGGLKSAMRAYRETSSTGVQKRNGDVLVTPEEFSYLDSTLQSLGFSTTRLNEIRRTRQDMFEYDKYFKARTSELKKQYISARENRDAPTMEDARAAWRQLQLAKKRAGFEPSPLSDLMAAPVEAKRREKAARDRYEAFKAAGGN